MVSCESLPICQRLRQLRDNQGKSRFDALLQPGSKGNRYNLPLRRDKTLRGRPRYDAPAFRLHGRCSRD